LNVARQFLRRDAAVNLPRLLVGERPDHAHIISLGDIIAKQYHLAANVCAGDLRITPRVPPEGPRERHSSARHRLRVF
jgi:hypothetical protein